MGNALQCPLFGQLNLATQLPTRINYWCDEDVTPRMIKLVEQLVQGIDGIEFAAKWHEEGFKFSLILSEGTNPTEINRIFLSALLEQTRQMKAEEIHHARQYDTSHLDAALAVSGDATSHERK